MIALMIAFATLVVLAASGFLVWERVAAEALALDLQRAIRFAGVERHAQIVVPHYLNPQEFAKLAKRRTDTVPKKYIVTVFDPSAVGKDDKPGRWVVRYEPEHCTLCGIEEPAPKPVPTTV